MRRGGLCFCLALLVPLVGIPAALAQAPAPAAAPEVGISAVKLAPITRQGQFIGTVVAVQQVDLMARVQGFLNSVDVTEGSFVKAGDVIFEIDKDTYQAALDGANAALQSANAAESGAEASLKQANVTLTRQTELFKSNAVSQSVVDQATATRDGAAAQVEQAKAQISEAQAQVKTAELNLSYTEVRTPISGRIGKAQVTSGNLASPSTGPLATVVQTDPIRVSFSISDREYLQVIAALKPVAGKFTAGANEFQPRLQLPDGTDYPSPGKIAFIDNRIDPTTGTIAVYADFPNPDLQLIPGQFVSIVVQAGQAQQLPVVPAAAVQQDRDGTYVLMLGDGNRATIRRITLGDRSGSDWAVTSGVANGETVIVSGIQKIKPGIVVTPVQAGN